MSMSGLRKEMSLQEDPARPFDRIKSPVLKAVQCYMQMALTSRQ